MSYWLLKNTNYRCVQGNIDWPGTVTADIILRNNRTFDVFEVTSTGREP